MRRTGPLSSRGVHRGGVSCRGAWALGCAGFSRCGAWLSSCGSWGLERTGSVALRNVGSSQIRDRTWVSCIGRHILHHWGTRKAAYSTPSGSPPTSHKLSPVLPSLGPLLRVPLPDLPTPTPGHLSCVIDQTCSSRVIMWDRGTEAALAPLPVTQVCSF